MGKRAAIIFFAFCLIFSIIALNLGCISAGIPESVNKSGGKSVLLSLERAPIYDCNNKKITNTNESFYAAIMPTQGNAEFLKGKILKSDYNVLLKNIEKSIPTIQSVSPSLPENKNITIIPISKRYEDKQLLSHTVGYLNYEGVGVSGLEKSFENLFKNNTIQNEVKFPCDARGNILKGKKPLKSTDPLFENSGVYLTVDLKQQEIAENCMDECNIDKGAMIVLEVGTGKIKAIVSRPNFNPNKIAESLKDERGPLVNRALKAFSVGSVFKPAIAACALEQNISPYIMYSCTGKTRIKNVEFGCYNRTAHGNVDMSEAIEQSCNCYFINLIQKIDIDEALSTLKSMGFGRKTQLCDGLVSESGCLPSAKELESEAARANFSFGQGFFTATPLQISVYMSVIASNGILYEPYLIEKTVDRGNEILKNENTISRRILKEDTAKTLKKFLQSAVEKGNGAGAKTMYVSSAGKTATAQTGRFKNNQEIYNTWFSGFFPAENPKYVVTVIKEDGSLGASDCAPVFSLFAKRISEPTK